MKHFTLAFFFLISLLSCDPIGTIIYVLDNKSKHNLSIVVNDIFTNQLDTVFCKNKSEIELSIISEIAIDCTELWCKNHFNTFEAVVAGNPNLSVTKNFNDSSSWTFKLISKCYDSSCTSECRIVIEDKDVK